VEVVGNCAPAASAALIFVEVGVVVGTDITVEIEESSLLVEGEEVKKAAVVGVVDREVVIAVATSLPALSVVVVKGFP